MIAAQELHGSSPVVGAVVLAALAVLELWIASSIRRRRGDAARWKVVRHAMFAGVAAVGAPALLAPDALGPATSVLVWAFVAMLGLSFIQERRLSPNAASSATSPVSRPGSDPGWSEALETASVFTLPFSLWRPNPARIPREVPRVPIVGLRVVYLSFVYALVLFLFVLSFMAPWDGGEEGWVPFFVAGFGALAVGGAWWFSTQPFRKAERGGVPTPPGTPADLLLSYRTRMFLGLAFVQAAGLMGFTGVFLSGSLWVYVLALAIAGGGHVSIVAPSGPHIARDQDLLREQGVSLDLLAALTTPPDPGARPIG